MQHRHIHVRQRRQGRLGLSLVSRKAWIALLAPYFVLGEVAQAFVVDKDITRHDQAEYLRYAQYVADTHFDGMGNRMQMPALPTLLALFTHPGMPQSEFFERAKIVCIVVAALACAVVVALMLRGLKATGPNVALVTAFFVFAFRGGYVQAEPLSYAAMFVAFLAMLRAWKTDRPLAFAAAGIASGLAYLVKATSLVGLGVLVACAATRAIVKRRVASVAHAALACAAFFVTIFPYARSTKQLYGSWLHNLNTSWVVWCDSFEQFSDLSRRVDLMHAPASELPSAGRYFATHTVGQMLWREVRGIAEVLANALISHGYAWFGAAYVVFFLMLLRRPEYRRVVFTRDASAAWIFVVTYLAAHLVVYGFWGAISAANRFILGVFAPAILSLARAIEQAEPERLARFDRGMRRAIVVALVTYYPVAIFTHYSGG